MGSLLSTSQSSSEWKSEAHFAMESSCFCVICGSPFDLEGEACNLDADAVPFKWMRNYRLLGSRYDIHEHNLNGLSKEKFHSCCYNASDSTAVFLSAKATWNGMNDQLFTVKGLCPDTNIPYTVTINAMKQTNNYDTVFPLHEDCLQISRRVIDHIRSIEVKEPDMPSLAILNKILQSRYRRNVLQLETNDPIAKNDLFDLCTATDTNGPRSVVSLSLLEWWGGEYEKFYTDPMSLPSLTGCVFDLLRGTTASETSRSYVSQPAREPYGLEGLPFELLDRIVDYLSIQSALALQLTSRMLALKLPLDDSFWRKTIISGKIPYMWDLDVEELERLHQEHLKASPNPNVMWGWRTIGKLLAAKRFPLNSSDPQIANLPIGLWNRWRIWSIIEEAYRCDFHEPSLKDRSDSIIGQRKRREPVFNWQLEEIKDDLGHYS